jgi:hypothetical protein
MVVSRKAFLKTLFQSRFYGNVSKLVAYLSRYAFQLSNAVRLTSPMVEM